MKYLVPLVFLYERHSKYCCLTLVTTVELFVFEQECLLHDKVNMRVV